MAIPDEDVAKVRAATDIAALITEHTALKRVGRRMVGLCPFHQEKTPSFSVNAEEGFYYCFGCQASGDAITFVRQVEGCDFVEAVERLAARAGVHVRVDSDPGDAPRSARRKALYDALESAVAFYHDRLLNGPDARPARDYLRSRGIDGELARRFRLGFAPAGYDDLAKSLRLPAAVSRETGLGFDNSRGRHQDVFRERVIFPIYDPGNRVIALGGRILPEELRRDTRDPGPKYRNSPESPIYQKRSTLYGLNWAKASIVQHHEAIICEGYTDVIGFAKIGIARAIATCGTALTEDHFRLLAHFAKRVVLCFDQDTAGQNAAGRLYEWERRHELELFVAALPEGSDPGELAETDPAALTAAIEAARPFLAFRVERALAAQDLSHPEGRSRAAEAALRAVAEHPSDLVRDQYLIDIADRTHADPGRLRDLLASLPTELAAPTPRSDNTTVADEPPLRDEPGGDGVAPVGARRAVEEVRAGRDALVLTLQRPADVAGRFAAALFTDDLQRAAFVALESATELHEAIDHAPSDVAELLRRLVASGDADELEIDGTLVALARSAAQAALGECEQAARRAQHEADEAALREVSATSRWLQEELGELRDPILRDGVPSPAIDAAERLVAWLSTRSGEVR
jgi:DNA primase